MARQHRFWGLAAALNETIEAWTATTNHTNQDDATVTANTAEAFTDAVWIPTEGNDFTVLMGVTQAATIGTVTYTIEGTADPLPEDANAVIAEVGTISHTVATADTAEYEGKPFSGSAWRYVRLKDYESTSTGNLSEMNAIIAVKFGNQS